jgi:excinuclease UvrABC nuclease subunit
MQQLLDFPEHVERTESIRQRQVQSLAFDDLDEAFDREFRALMFELENIMEEARSIQEFRSNHSMRDNLEALHEQKLRLTKWAVGT